MSAAPPIRLRHLYANHAANTARRGIAQATAKLSARMPFVATDPDQQLEAAQDMLRLARWPDQFGWALKPEPRPPPLAHLAEKIEDHQW